MSLTLDQWITIGTAFGATLAGVFVGAGVTFFIETMAFRRREAKNKRTNFQVVLVTAVDAYEGIIYALDCFTSLVEDERGIISSQFREVVNFNILPIIIDKTVLFAVADEEDVDLFSQVNLLIRRHNTSVEASKALIAQKARFIEISRERGYFVEFGEGDQAKVSVPSDDHDFMMELYRTENLTRTTLKLLLSNRRFASGILRRLNQSSKRKFKKKPPRFEVAGFVPELGWIDSLEDFEIPRSPFRGVPDFYNMPVYASSVKYSL